MSTIKNFFFFFVEVVHLFYSSVSLRFNYCNPDSQGLVISAVHSYYSVSRSTFFHSAFDSWEA